VTDRDGSGIKMSQRLSIRFLENISSHLYLNAYFHKNRDDK